MIKKNMKEKRQTAEEEEEEERERERKRGRDTDRESLDRQIGRQRFIAVNEKCIWESNI